MSDDNQLKTRVLHQIQNTADRLTGAIAGVQARAVTAQTALSRGFAPGTGGMVPTVLHNGPAEVEFYAGRLDSLRELARAAGISDAEWVAVVQAGHQEGQR